MPDNDLKQVSTRALLQIEEAILSLLARHPSGLRNIEIAKALGLESAPGISQKNMLTWGILKRMVADGRVVNVTVRTHPVYRLSPQTTPRT